MKNIVIIGGGNQAHYTIDIIKKEGKYKTSVEYQICDANSCLPPTYEDFEVQINAFDAEKKDSIVESQTIVTETNFADSISNESATQNTENITTDDGIYGKFGKLLNDCSSKTEELNAFTAFIAGILGGFLALFFPCTFPMIPMTMSFFLKGNQKDKGKGTRNAIFYGFAIFLVYFLLNSLWLSTKVIFLVGAVFTLRSKISKRL
jgi:thiol:disulfide interchange protein DsbD